MSEIMWEAGSEFHWMEMAPGLSGATVRGDCAYFSSGRAALLALVRLGMKNFGWKRVFLPAYCCQEIITALKDAPIAIDFYDDLPGSNQIEKPVTRPGDVLYIINFFGHSQSTKYTPFYQQNIPVIEDHTHDPWSDWCSISKADYIVVSCRKTIPIPDGGIVFSPANRPLPHPENCGETITEPASSKLQGMLLKALYLKGGLADKNIYRQLFHAGEDGFAAQDTRPMSTVSREVWKSFPWREWRQKRRQNFARLVAGLRDRPAFDIMIPQDQNLCPFAFIMLFPDNCARELAKSWLIDNNVYPAVLWPLDHSATANARAVDFSGRMLAIHCDGRYNCEDIDRIISIIRSCPERGK